MLTPNQKNYLQRLIREQTKAAIDLSWVGAAHPDDREDIEAAYAKAKDSLDAYLKKLSAN